MQYKTKKLIKCLTNTKVWYQF